MNKLLILGTIGVVSFGAGVAWSWKAQAAEPGTPPQAASPSPSQAQGASKPRVVYPKKTDLDLEGAAIEGELRNPGEFYFQHRPEEKFDSLVKRRKNFHREMLRDAVLSK